MSSKGHGGAVEKGRPDISRRGFVKLVGGSAAAALAGSSAIAPHTKAATPAGKGTGAEALYQCKDNLKPFSSKNNAFKKVSEELGQPWLQLWLKNIVGNVKNAAIGKGIPVKDTRAAREHLSFWVGAGALNRIIGPYGEGLENKGLLSWKPMKVPPMFVGNPDPNPDAGDLTKKVKQMARFYGAAQVGVAQLNRKWVLDETCRNAYDPDPPKTQKIVFKDVKQPEETETELAIPETVKYAIVIVVNQDRLTSLIGPASVQTSAASGMGYGRMGITVVALAEAIRTLGYNAIPSMNDTALSVPLAVDAGLGQLGRHGMLITREYGSVLRLGKVLTDMPLVADSPVDFGVTEFCQRCKKCATNCPANCISFGERSYDPQVDTGNPEALKWYINGKKCLQYWIDSGASCAACQAVCTYSKGSFWGHGVIRGMTAGVPMFDSVFAQLDDVFGYGAMRKPDEVWERKIFPFGIDPTKEII